MFKQYIFILINLFCFLPAQSQNLDIELLRKINLDRNKNLDPVFIAITNSVTPMIIIVPSGMILSQLVHKDSAQLKKTILICSSVLVAGGITTVLKYGINRPRPGETYPDIEVITSVGSPSFPSGHTSTSFALATSLSIAYPKWYVIAPSFIWASAVAYSRMDLGAHYPSDVLAGAIIGSGSTWLCYRLNKWYFKQRRHSDNY